MNFFYDRENHGDLRLTIQRITSSFSEKSSDPPMLTGRVPARLINSTAKILTWAQSWNPKDRAAMLLLPRLPRIFEATISNPHHFLTCQTFWKNWGRIFASPSPGNCFSFYYFKKKIVSRPFSKIWRNKLPQSSFKTVLSMHGIMILMEKNGNHVYSDIKNSFFFLLFYSIKIYINNIAARLLTCWCTPPSFFFK